MAAFKGHLAGGAITFGLIVATLHTMKPHFKYNVPQLGFWIVFCLFGALFPDIDIQSKGQKIFYRILIFAFILGLVYQQGSLLIVTGFAAIFPHLVRHRGIMHSVWFILLVPAILPYIIALYKPKLLHPALTCYLFFVAGAFSHLLLDFGVLGLLKRTFGFSNKHTTKKYRRKA